MTIVEAPSIACENCAARQFCPLVCLGCGVLGPEPEELSDFAVFGLEPHFVIDPADLDDRLGRLSAAVHPDHFATALPYERDLAVSHLTRINAAYERLRDGRARANLVLNLTQPLEVALDRSVPPGLFEEVLELREEIESGMTPERTRQIVRAMHTRLAEAWATISDALLESLVAFRAGDSAACEVAGRRARVALNVTKYFENLRAEAETRATA